MRRRNAMYYDLEGPISSQDHAQAVCKRFIPDGDKLFAVLSRYDDILTLANKEEYEPGDTLKLIIPFLIEAKVTESDLRAVSAEAGLVPGIRELFTELQEQNCLVWIISTSYEQHSFMIALKVGAPWNRVYATGLPLVELQEKASAKDLRIIRRIQKRAIKLYDDDLASGTNDELIQNLLAPFFWEDLPKTKFSQAIKQIVVIGGRRKVKALEAAVRRSTEFLGYLSDAFIVVDSITDFRMAQAVEAAGGIALAWNGNQYIIPYATCGVAAIDARAVRPLFQAWREGGRIAVREFVESAPEPANSETGPYYHWLAGESPEFHQKVLVIHKRLRTICRGAEVAKLG